MSPIKFVTWNIRGIGSETKKVLNHLTHLDSDICPLQETHLSASDHQKLKSSKFNQVFSTTYNSRQRGVSILISRKLSLIHNTTITDPEGRYIIISVSINNTDFTIANLYGPNSDDPSFFHTFFSTLDNFSDTKIIIGGDFNTVF